MRVQVIQSSNISKCRLHIWSAHHWIPEHRLEECDPELKERVKREVEDARYRRDLAVEQTLKRFEVDVDSIKARIRHSKD